MKILFTGLLIFFSCTVIEAREVQLFNTDVLGMSTLKEVKLLNERISTEIEPSAVMVDIKCGSYYGATLTYKDVTFDEAKASIDKFFQKYENKQLYKKSETAVWRIVDKRFVISLVKEEEEIKILYIQFQSEKEGYNIIFRSMGSETDNINTERCR